MAKRTVFIYDEINNEVIKKTYEFEFHKGGSLIANRRSIEELHNEIRKDGFEKIAEVSRNSTLNFKPLREDTVIYQFNGHAPNDFSYEGAISYDRLYIEGLLKLPESSKLALEYNVFTDLAYHSDRYNSAARSLAIYRYLVKNDLVEKFMNKKSSFKRLYKDLL